jgi:UDP-N-acetylglucosamine:LPS N-acetylglucosamine transferase
LSAVQHVDVTSDQPSQHVDVLFASSAGGHLAQLIQLRPWFEERSRSWVTFELPDAVSVLEHEQTVWAFHPTTRNVPNLLRNFRLAWTIVRRTRPKVVVSSGAGIAVPFFWIGKLFGAKNVYLEVIDRIDSRTLTTRLCSPVTDLIVVQDEGQGRLFPGCSVIGRLL